ncbi:MAG: zf-HC2 domain-containing protein [Planctomycetota bacterium]|nr:zf-HC2 domain-containing protein [Planctomycetota bacterium]
MWMNNCRKYRADLALLAGNDLDAATRLEVERHVVTCPECRAHWQELQSSQQALEQSRGTAVVVSLETSSVWVDVQRQIRVVDERSRRGSWRGWLPAVAMAAACLAVILITSDILRESTVPPEFTRQPAYSAGTPVSFSTSSAQPTIVPASAEELVPERLEDARVDDRPRRRSNRAERLSNGPYRGF